MGIKMAGPWEHPSGIFYLRRRVPADLLSIVKGRVVSLSIAGKPVACKLGALAKASLKTRDPATAKERLREAEGSLEAWFKALREGPRRLSQRQVEALAGFAYTAFADAFSNDPGPPDRWVGTLVANLRATTGDPYGLHIGKPSAAAISMAMESRFGSIADAVLQKEKVITDVGSRWKVIEAIARALDQAALLNLKRAEGDYRPDPEADRFPDWRANLGTAVAVPLPQVSLTGLWDAWRVEAERLGRAAATVKRYRPCIVQFVEFLGHDDALAVTAQDIRRWRGHLIEKGAVQASTFSKLNRAAISAALGTGVDSGSLVSNVAKNLSLRSEKKRSTRETGRTFTHAEATVILRASLEALEASGSHDRETRLVRRWGPWLMAYSGARVGEVCQLRKEDFRTDGAIDYFLITPDAGTVKTGAARAVPVHDHLKEQGLMAFVRSAPDGPLFYRISPTGKGSAPAKAQRLAEWVRSLGVGDSGISPNHAWRHYFRTAMDGAGVEQKYTDAICGHASRTQGETYGMIGTAMRYREISKLPRIDL